MELTKTFTLEQYARALESWHWLDPLDGKTPRFTSLFGDVFFEAADGWWYLDTLGGELKRPWDSRDLMGRVLATEDGQDEYLLGGLAMAADRKGIRLGPDQVYDFTHPPALGGSFDVKNIQTIDFVVGVNIAGQIHHQIHDLPPGTQISGFRIAE